MEALGAVLDAIVPELEDVNTVERYDLAEYLERTAAIAIAPAERLRQLAIHLERQWAVWDAPVLRRWRAVDRVYEAAIELDPSSVDVWTSRGITALEGMKWAQSEVIAPRLEREKTQSEEIALRLEGESRAALSRALELDPNDAHATCTVGLLGYFARRTEEALEWLDRALALDPSHVDARMYRAHCLHDLSRWSEAVAAYGAVPSEALVASSREWLVVYLLEARALCRLKSGDRDGALRDFDAVLCHYESDPDEALYQLFIYLEEAATGELADELGARFSRLMGDRHSSERP